MLKDVKKNMNSNVLLSVIVPIYNREKTLPELLKTFLKVKNQNFEVILVNDGSTDESERVCVDFALKDNRFKFINKQNGGVSSARNAGIDAATGDFLAFFDGDDLFIPETLDRAIDMLCECHEDVLIFDFNYYDIVETNYRKSHFVLPSDHVLNKDEIVKLIIEPLILKRGTDFAGIWNKLFAAKFFGSNGVRFRENMFYGEDWRFILDFLDVCETVRYIPEILYIYRLDGTQTESKYKHLPGVCALDSYKCKNDLSRKYGIAIPKDEAVRQSLGIMNEIAFSKGRCSKQEFFIMLNDNLAKLAAKRLLSLGKKERLQYEVTKRYLIFAFFVEKQNASVLSFFKRFLSKK